MKCSLQRQNFLKIEDKIVLGIYDSCEEWNKSRVNFIANCNAQCKIMLT